MVLVLVDMGFVDGGGGLVAGCCVGGVVVGKVVTGVAGGIIVTRGVTGGKGWVTGVLD